MGDKPNDLNVNKGFIEIVKSLYFELIFFYYSLNFFMIPVT